MAMQSVLEIWIADLDAIRDFPRSALELLEESEFEKLSQFREKSNRRRYLLSRILLRKAIARRLGTQLKGAPSAAGFEYSLSYSGSLVVLAVSDACKLGVDAEWVDRAIFEGPGGDKWLESVFTPKERASLAKVPEKERWLASLRLWTIKEAYAKFLGLGHEVEFSTFEVDDSGKAIVHPVNGSNFAQDIRIESREITLRAEKYHIALAARPLKGEVPPLSIFKVDHLEPLELFRYEDLPASTPSVRPGASELRSIPLI